VAEFELCFSYELDESSEVGIEKICHSLPHCLCVCGLALNSAITLGRQALAQVTHSSLYDSSENKQTIFSPI